MCLRCGNDFPLVILFSAYVKLKGWDEPELLNSSSDLGLVVF